MVKYNPINKESYLAEVFYHKIYSFVHAYTYVLIKMCLISRILHNIPNGKQEKTGNKTLRKNPVPRTLKYKTIHSGRLESSCRQFSREKKS